MTFMTEGKTLVGGRAQPLPQIGKERSLAKPNQLPAGPRKKRPLGRLFSSTIIIFILVQYYFPQTPVRLPINTKLFKYSFSDIIVCDLKKCGKFHTWGGGSEPGHFPHFFSKKKN